MKAIVLTYDHYRVLTDHMIACYARVWPDHPFVFQVPYQDLAPTIMSDRVVYRRTPAPIKSTVLALLESLDDDEWVYWCIDDKYPLEFDLPRVRDVYHWIESGVDADVAGVMFCRCRKMWMPAFLGRQGLVDNTGNFFIERNSYAQIWIHQFLRVKVLRQFYSFAPDVFPVANYMDARIPEMTMPADQRLFVTAENMAVFGESASRGVVTDNCYQSLLDSGVAIPEWCETTTGRNTLLGKVQPNWQGR